MKSFKQYLNEDKSDKLDRYTKDIVPHIKKDPKDKKLKEAKIGTEYSNAMEIRFDSLGSGFECTINPFDGELGNFNDQDSHKFSISVFSSGSVYYYRTPTDEENEMMEKVKNKEIDFKKGPRYIIIQEMKKVMNTEILKAASEFDKKIETILKKHGFEKKSK